MNKLYIAVLLALCLTEARAQSFQQVKDLRVPGDAAPHAYTLFNGKIYFGANEGSGIDLWVTDGTAAGTAQITNDNFGNNSFYGITNPPVVLGTKMIFVGTDASGFKEPCITDGTSGGTSVLKDIHPSLTSEPSDFTVYNGHVIFSAKDGTNGQELWITDATTSGTTLLKDINSSGDSYPGFFKEYNGKLYFKAIDNTSGAELWRTDGTDTGTYLVKDIYSGISGSSPTEFVVYNGYLYFSAADSATGYELWKTDGTALGTTMVKDVNPGTSHSSPSYLTVVGNTLFFAADDGTNGVELWKTDGTTNGTTLVKNINATGDANVQDVFAALGKLFFTADDGTHGLELWVSDGTLAGTQLVKDIWSGGGSSVFCQFQYQGQMLFTADDGTNGYDIWITDGTNQGTHKISNPGNQNNSPLSSCRGFTEYNGWLYYTANYDNTGEEMWRLQLSANGINTETEKDNSILVFPNPASSVVCLTGDMKEGTTVRIFSIDGKQELIAPFSPNKQIDISSLNKGVYVIESDGRYVQRARFIKIE